MITSLILRGRRGAVLVGGYPGPGTLGAWTIVKPEGAATWTLRARLDRVDRWQLRYARPLRFTAPRPGGFWSWPIAQVQALTDTELIARLGPPEQ